MKTFYKDKLKVNVYENRTLMGEGAASDIKEKIKQLLEKKRRDKYDFCRCTIAK